jgi:Phage minor structural protein GP20.
MKREEVKAICPDITDEQLGKIMDLGSRDIGKLKQDLVTATTERDTLRTQLGEANTQIQSYKDMDIDGIKKAAQDWETKYNTDTQALKDKLTATEYGYGVERAVSGMKFSSAAAKKQFVADLTAKKLPLQEGKLLGMEDYVKQYKESDPDAFAPEDDKTPIAVRGSGGSAGGNPDAALRAAMGLPTDKK